MATHASILAWRIPWTEEPGGLQFMGSQTIGHNPVTHSHTHTHTHTHTHSEGFLWINKQQPLEVGIVSWRVT